MFMKGDSVYVDFNEKGIEKWLKMSVDSGLKFGYSEKMSKSLGMRVVYDMEEDSKSYCSDCDVVVGDGDTVVMTNSFGDVCALSFDCFDSISLDEDRV